MCIRDRAEVLELAVQGKRPPRRSGARKEIGLVAWEERLKYEGAQAALRHVPKSTAPRHRLAGDYRYQHRATSPKTGQYRKAGDYRRPGQVSPQPSPSPEQQGPMHRMAGDYRLPESSRHGGEAQHQKHRMAGDFRHGPHLDSDRISGAGCHVNRH
eukprot:TRINITY_DN36836_c0_g1_i4.p2 TRINITY_DN36836_c0_g1~~TRINITY_DN36836_c0_g1_i4.p2  ORF type:complete len:156 (-),score=18.27 TRINITY_DN36836_c0_g1_i4:404-871(-)